MSFLTVLVLLVTACAPSVVAQPMAELLAPTEPDRNLAWLFQPTPVGDEIASYQLVAVDLTAGGPAEAIAPVDVGQVLNYAYSPDHTRLAVVGRADQCPQGCLRVLRLADGQVIAQAQLAGLAAADQWVQQVVFDAVGQRVALIYSDAAKGRLALVDLENTQTPQVSEIELGAVPRLVAFTVDGGHLMLIGQAYPQDKFTAWVNPRVQALLVEANGALDIIWREDLAEVKDGYYGSGDYEKPEENFFYQAGLVADPAMERIYIAHAEADRLTTVDFASRAVATRDVRPPQTLLERALEFVVTFGVHAAQAKSGNSFMCQALLSPDGKTLYRVGEQSQMVKNERGDYDINFTSRGLQVWEVSGATLRLSVESEANELHVAPDGRLLLYGYDHDSSIYRPYTEIFDPTADAITARMEKTRAYPTLSLDGRPLLVTSYYTERRVTSVSFVDLQLPGKQVEWEAKDLAYFPELK